MARSTASSGDGIEHLLAPNGYSYGSLQLSGSRAHSNGPLAPGSRGKEPGESSGRTGLVMLRAALVCMSVISVSAAVTIFAAALARSESVNPHSGGGIQASRAGNTRSRYATSAGLADAHPGHDRSRDANDDNSSPPRHVPAVAEAKQQPSSLTFTARNAYDDEGNRKENGYDKEGQTGALYYPWLAGVKVIEPHRQTTLKVSNPRDGFEYRWTIVATADHGDRNLSDTATEGGVVELTAVGTEAVVVLDRRLLDRRVVVVLEEVATGAGRVARTLKESVIVRYVRREVRTLTDSEREELLDAMYTLWNVKADEGGRERFGEDYADIWEIARVHFAAASEMTCDHFHDGLGFLTSHTMLTNTFEHSLQLVNPKLALPYWDYTIDAAAGHSTDGPGSDFQDTAGDVEPQRLSPLFTSSWFGSSDPVDKQVKDGRWAFTKVPDLDPDTDEGLGDIYSRLRSPWTINDRPYLSRGLGDVCGFRVEDGYPWPTCKTHYDLTKKQNDFHGWVWNSQYDPHGTVHIWLGGALDCAPTYHRIGEVVGRGSAAGLAYVSFVHRKDLYRDGVWYCTEESVAEGRGRETPTGHTCGCLDYDLEEGDDYKEVLGLLIKADVLQEYDEDTQRTVVSMICNATLADGDQLQSSSPLDPIFWLIHPTIERLWMFKQVTGTMTDTFWPDADTAIPPSLQTAADPVTAPMSPQPRKLSIYGDQCRGHRGSDIYPFEPLPGIADPKVFSGIVSGAALLQDDQNLGEGRNGHESRRKLWEKAGKRAEKGVPSEERMSEMLLSEKGTPAERLMAGNGEVKRGKHVLTNREVLDALDPRVNMLSYVYDNFRWDHCAQQGIDFASLRSDEYVQREASAETADGFDFVDRRGPREARSKAGEM